jgi:hypothetical protein
VSSRAERRLTGADVVFELLVSPFVDLIDYRVLDILLPFGNQHLDPLQDFDCQLPARTPALQIRVPCSVRT